MTLVKRITINSIRDMEGRWKAIVSVGTIEAFTSPLYATCYEAMDRAIQFYKALKH